MTQARSLMPCHGQPPVALRTTSAAFAAMPGRTPAMTCSGPLMSATHLHQPAQVLGLDRRQHAAERHRGRSEMMIRRLRTWFSPIAEDDDEQRRLDVAAEDQEISTHSDSPAPV